MSETNSLLRNLNERSFVLRFLSQNILHFFHFSHFRYRNLSKTISQVSGGPSPKEIEAREAVMLNRLGRMVESLKSKMEAEDESLRNTIGGTQEEIEMLRRTTTSRQKVSDARMDGLESLVMEVSSRPQSPDLQHLPSNDPQMAGGDLQEQFPWIGPTDATTTMRTTSTSTPSLPPTTEPDFSMLGLASLSELDHLAPWEEEHEVEQLYRGIRRQRGKVGVEEELLLLLLLKTCC